MRGLCRPERASRRFTVQFEFTGPGGGCWTIRVADGACRLAEEAADRPDLTFRMSADTFNLAMIRRAVNPAVAMLTGRVRVRGLSKMPTFVRLFPQPAPDRPITVRASS
jgi:putative sterol carrier protein